MYNTIQVFSRVPYLSSGISLVPVFLDTQTLKKHTSGDADLSIPSSDLFKKLKWLPFPKFVEYQQSVTVYKSLNELNPHYMNKLFSYTQENHSYGTRNATSSLLAFPKRNKSIGQKCISYPGPKVWNGLTEAIKCAPSLPSFKSRYLKAMYCTYYFVTLGPLGYL